MPTLHALHPPSCGLPSSCRGNISIDAEFIKDTCHALVILCLEEIRTKASNRDAGDSRKGRLAELVAEDATRNGANGGRGDAGRGRVELLLDLARRADAAADAAARASASRSRSAARRFTLAAVASVAPAVFSVVVVVVVGRI